MEPSSPPPEPTPPPAAPPPRSWRKRHPVAARALLYGLAAVVLGGGAVWAAAYRRASRQEALLTRLHAVDQLGLVRVDPEGVLKIVRDEVLPEAASDDLVRRAHLVEASALDALGRRDEAEAVYAAVAAALPAGTPRGPVVVPWANLRVNAGRAGDALALLDTPGATDGWPADGAEGWRAVRARAEATLPR